VVEEEEDDEEEDDEEPVPERMNVVIENPGTVALTTPPLILAVNAVGCPLFDDWSLTHAVTAAKLSLNSIDTASDALLSLITCTDTVPSVFTNALVVNVLRPLVVATRTAPGRT